MASKQKCRTKFQQSWLKDFAWLKPVCGDSYKGHCVTCKKDFRIDGSGRSQVVSHQKSHSVKDGGKNDKKKAANDPKQTVFQPSAAGVINIGSSTTLTLTHAEKVCRAVIYRALQVAHCNYSFNSAQGDAAMYKAMFPSSPVAQSYSQGDGKVKYNLQFGIAPYCKEQLLYDVKRKPFTFKFDETTNRKVDKQYDGYVQYWSDTESQIVNRYCGSLFLGHCTSDNLVDHFNEFMVNNNLDPNYLLHIGMDGPRVNTAFQDKLSTHLKDNLDTSFLNLGTCSLHPVHTAFRKGITSMSFDLDSFFIDLHFFFKLSSARREDYSNLHSLTDTMDKYAMKHVETRWLSMKFVAVRVVEQWGNLAEYFLKFLPKDKKTFRTIKETKRYQQIHDALSDNFTLATVSFCAFAARDFEMFLLPFQSDIPMIHMLYPEMTNLLRNLMTKFIRSKYIDEMAPQLGLHTLNVDDKTKRKSENFIDIGTKAKTLFADVDFLPSDKQIKFREDCMEFYIKSVSYLQLNLPFDNLFLKYAQYLNPSLRTDAASTSAVSNLALCVAIVLTNCLHSVFGISVDETREGLVDLVRNQWRMYQVETIPEEWYQMKDEGPSTRVQQSYWKYALGICMIEPVTSPIKGQIRMDEYWHKVSKMTDATGLLKYPQLAALIKCVLSLSHGNAVPERGFSINKIMMEAHGYTIDNETISALRLVKDAIHRVGAVHKFTISRKLITSCFESYNKYHEYTNAKLKQKERDEALKAQKEEAVARKQAQKRELESINSEIVSVELQMKAADEIIAEGNKELGDVLQSTDKKKVDKKKIEGVQSKLAIGIGQKRQLEERLDKLKKKKVKM